MKRPPKHIAHGLINRHRYLKAIRIDPGYGQDTYLFELLEELEEYFPVGEEMDE